MTIAAFHFARVVAEDFVDDSLVRPRRGHIARERVSKRMPAVEDRPLAATERQPE